MPSTLPLDATEKEEVPGIELPAETFTENDQYN